MKFLTSNLIEFHIIGSFENFISDNPMLEIMRILSNALAGFSTAFGITLTVAMANVLTSYVAKGRTLTEIVQGAVE